MQIFLPPPKIYVFSYKKWTLVGFPIEIKNKIRFHILIFVVIIILPREIMITTNLILVLILIGNPPSESDSYHAHVRLMSKID